MEALFQIVGCVLASKSAAEQVDAFVAHVRRERGVVMARTAQGATFVRFNAPDARLVTLACQAVRGHSGHASSAAVGPATLRFGFAAGLKEGGATGVGQEGLDISTRSVVQANDLAAAAADGEVLVSPQLAVLLIDAGFALRSRQVQLAGGRTMAACALELEPAAALPGAAPMLGSAPMASAGAPAAPKAEGLDAVMRALLAQADEMARRQAELEARQDAVLGKMTLADEGSVSARHLEALEAELQAQVARVEAKLDFITGIEQRMQRLHSTLEQAERTLAQCAPRLAEVAGLKGLCDQLVAQMVGAHEQLRSVAAAQERLLPVPQQAEGLAQTLAQSQQTLSLLQGRLAALEQSSAGVQRQIDSLAQREAAVRAVKAEVDELVQAGRQARTDLRFLEAHRGEVSELRAQVALLLGEVEATDSKIEAVALRRKTVEEVQARATAITHMLGDIQLNLEMLGEQRAVVDHVGEQLARLDYTVQQAQNTLRALQREREVAERIEQGMKSLRMRSGIHPQPT